MTATNGSRYQAWLDSLPQAQLAMVQRTEGMPIEMALHYMWVDIDTKIEDLRRPFWRHALAPVAVAGAFVAGFFGTDGSRWGA